MILETLNEYFPPAIALIILLVGSGFLGLFRALAIRKQANDDTIASLQRQVKVLEQELEVYRKLLDK